MGGGLLLRKTLHGEQAQQHQLLGFRGFYRESSRGPELAEAIATTKPNHSHCA